LDTVPDNRTELDSETKITQLLVKAYPDNHFAVWTNVMADDHDDIGPNVPTMSQWYEFMLQAWNWQEIKEEDNDSPNSTWEYFYYAIAHANQALKAIDDLGNPPSLSAQRGEALVARAWCHFRLVNLFCQHYSTEHSATDLGIPYMETPETEVKPTYERGTVKEVYEKIARDIEEGLPLIDDAIYSQPKYHFNRSAANAFAAEFYLYYRNYDKAIAHANEVLGKDPERLMRDVSVGWPDQGAMPADVEIRGRAYIDHTVNANLLIMTSIGELGLTTSNYYAGKRYLYSSYIHETEVLTSPSILWRTDPTNDANRDRMFYLRSFVFLSTPEMPTRLNIPYLFEITNPAAQTGYRRAVSVIYTVESALFARIEANILKENYAAAMDDINLWVKKRINPEYADPSPKTEAQVAEYYGPLTATGGQEYYTSTVPTTRKKMNPEVPFVSDKQEAFIHALLHMRRIEFFEEGLRLFDVKRYGIEITRRTYVEESGSRLVEEIDKANQPRDPRLVVQLPVAVISAGMTPNPR
jgi:tetratricopeptide (TPR) repeat protein